MKKKFYSIIVGLLLTAGVFAQSPQKMSYQAVIRNSSNILVTNSVVGMKFSVLQSSINGAAVYVETHTPSTNANGLVSIEIGGGAFISGSFANINWANGPYFLKTETDPLGGVNYSITGTSQLLSVPYALHAKTAETIVGSNGGGGFLHYIGEQFGGGVIFHLWKDAQGIEHGLVVSINNNTFYWSNVTSDESFALSSWDGLSNSNAIVNQVGHLNSAAKLCLDLVENGFSDWYLPALDELGLLWQNRFNVNKTLTSMLGATQLGIMDYTWSSTELDDNQVWYFYFANGSFFINSTTNNKQNDLPFRAIRSF